MWAYLGSSSLNRSSPEELSAAEVEAQIHRVIDFIVNPLRGASSDPFRRGNASVSVSTLGPVSASFTILSFHRAHDFIEGLGDGRSKLWDVDPPVEATGWEASHASNGAA
jgi:hypothetical protein